MKAWLKNRYCRIKNKIVNHFLNKWLEEPWFDCPRYSECEDSFLDDRPDDSIRECREDAYD